MLAFGFNGFFFFFGNWAGEAWAFKLLLLLFFNFLSGKLGWYVFYGLKQVCIETSI